MEKSEIEDVLKQAITACAQDEGWANLAEIGAVLRNNGIKYGKLSKFLNDYTHIVDTKIDESITPPAVYAKLKETE